MSHPLGDLGGGAGFQSYPALPWEYYHITAGNPPFQTEWNYTIGTLPQELMLELIHVEYQFNSNAIVVNRFPNLLVQDAAGSNIYYAGHNGPQGASSNWVYYYDVGISPYDQLPALHMAIPPKIILTPGMRIGSLTAAAFGNTDTYTSINIMFRRYLTQAKLSFT